MYGHRARRAVPLLGFSFLTVLAACGESVAPDRRDVELPVFLELGTQPAIRGVGTTNTGTPTAGSNLQQFDFNVAADLTGRLVYRDWRHEAALTVDPMDPATRITAFRDGAALCAAAENGAEFDAIGRRDSGELLALTILVCDDGAAGSGRDGFSITVGSEYHHAGRLSSGDIVKTAVALASTTGTLSITTSTMGENKPERYTLTATGPNFPSGTMTTIGANATVSATVEAGTYTVSLSDVPFNCTVDGGTSRTVTVETGGTGNASFSVSCTALKTGTLAITTSTTGEGIPSTYMVTVTGPSFPAGFSTTIGVNATLSGTVIAGDYTVRLTVPTNCTSDATSRTVSVSADGAATASYSVSCTNQPPVVNAGPDATALVGLLSGITASFSDPNHNGPWSYTIDWGDGSRTSGTTASEGTISAGHAYFTLLPRSFTVRVTVRDAAGAVGSDTKTITVLLL